MILVVLVARSITLSSSNPWGNGTCTGAVEDTKVHALRGQNAAELNGFSRPRPLNRFAMQLSFLDLDLFGGGMFFSLRQR